MSTDLDAPEHAICSAALKQRNHDLLAATTRAEKIEAARADCERQYQERTHELIAEIHLRQEAEARLAEVQRRNDELALNAEQWAIRAKGLEAQIVTARAEERERCAKAIEDYGNQCNAEYGGTIGEMTMFALCAEHIRQLGGGPCEN